MRVLAGLLLCASASAMASITARAPQGNRRSLGLNRKLADASEARKQAEAVQGWLRKICDTPLWFVMKGSCDITVYGKDIETSIKDEIDAVGDVIDDVRKNMDRNGATRRRS